MCEKNVKIYLNVVLINKVTPTVNLVWSIINNNQEVRFNTHFV